MAQNDWHIQINQIQNLVFEISTPYGRGSGFLIFYSEKLLGIATAYHVIDQARRWRQPVEVKHYNTGKSEFLNSPIIYVDPTKDLAVIAISNKNLQIKLLEQPTLYKEMILKPGVEIAWCGFPSVAPDGKLCFFEGYVSCYLEKEDAYLVDGVSINGVSGGPAFFINISDEHRTTIAGVISAYAPNRITGETLPGLAIVRSVLPYQEMLRQVKTLEEFILKIEKKSTDKKSPPG